MAIIKYCMEQIIYCKFNLMGSPLDLSGVCSHLSSSTSPSLRAYLRHYNRYHLHQGRTFMVVLNVMPFPAQAEPAAR